MRHPTKEELDALYPRSMFPDNRTYELAMDSLSKYVTCDECEHFIDVRFDDGYGQPMDGVCRKRHVAIPNKVHASCE